MANVNETTTRFNVDITDLKKAMQDAKRSIAVANSEFKAVASSMDDWSKSTEGLQAKLKQLDSNLKSQERILGSLEAQYEEVVRTQGEGSKAADDLKIKINNQKAVVNKTQKEIEKYTDALNDLGDDGKKAAKNNKNVADSLEDVGKEAEKAGDGFTVFKGAVATLAGNLMTSLVSALGSAVSSLAGLATETREYRKEMGKLETAFTSAGHSTEAATETYKDLYAVLGDEGQAVEAANMLAKLTTSEKELAQWTNIATGVYGTFGASLPIESLTEAANETAKTGSLTGALADALNWAGVSEDDFQAKLDACTTEQQRNALITETLNGLYSDAAETFKEVNGSIMDAQRAESELADATAALGEVFEPIVTTFKLFGAEVINSILPYVQLLGAGFTDLMNGVDGGAESIGTALGGMVDMLLDRLVTALPQVASIAVDLVGSLLKTLLNAAPQLGDVALTLVSELVTMIGDSAPMILGVLSDLIMTLVSSIGDMLPQILSAATNIISSLLAELSTLLPELALTLIDILTNTLIPSLLEQIPTLLSAACTFLLAIVDAIPIIVVALIDALPMIIDCITSVLLDNMPLLLSTAVTVLMALVNAIPTILSALVAALPQIVTTIMSAIFQLIPQLAVFVGELLVQLGAWIVSLVTKGSEGASKFVTSVIDWVKQLPSKVSTWLNGVLPNIITWGANLATKGKEAATKLFNAIVDKIKGLPDELKSMGSDIVKGLWNGINDMTSWIGDKISGFGDSVVSGLKDFFGIASPSKLMRDEIGRWLPEGIAVGIDKNAKSVLSSMRDLTAGTVMAARDGLGDTSTGLGGAMGGVVYNFNQVNNSPKALSRLEIYRQSKNLLGYAGGM